MVSWYSVAQRDVGPDASTPVMCPRSQPISVVQDEEGCVFFLFFFFHLDGVLQSLETRQVQSGSGNRKKS